MLESNYFYFTENGQLGTNLSVDGKTIDVKNNLLRSLSAENKNNVERVPHFALKVKSGKT